MGDLNSLEEIQRLYAKPKTYKIPFESVDNEEQISIKVQSLDLDQMADDELKISKDDPLSKIAKSSKKLIALSLGTTEDAAGKISIKHMEDIMKCIEKENNFKGEDKENFDKMQKFMADKNQKIRDQKSREAADEQKSTGDTQNPAVQ